MSRKILEGVLQDIESLKLFLRCESKERKINIITYTKSLQFINDIEEDIRKERKVIKDKEAEHIRWLESFREDLKRGMKSERGIY